MNTVNDSSLHWESAQTIASAACAHAVAQGLKICVWVLDPHGNPLAMQRVNNAPLPCTEIAKGKAYTAGSFGFATHLWQQRLSEQQHLLDGLNVQKDVVLFGGGLPIKLNGKLIGSIGVSGASAAQDQECAEAGIAVLPELTS